MEEELEVNLQDLDDDSYTPGAHNKLLGAVSELYEKKRVKAPTRKEPSLEVSEFHLSRPDKKRGQIKVTELAKVLNKRTTHADISQKLKNAQKQAKTLPKPLEKIYQDKIHRKAGYEHAKQQLNRWDAIVYKQKVAEQVSFPLKSETIKVQESSDVSTLFRKPTELEIELAKVLNQPNPFEDKNEEKKGSKDHEEDYPLTLAEVMEKRKMMAKLRAQQSYQQAKAARHSKIKSKKFHQIQRRARVKEQLREFEELQRKDPEAALKKLEELERTRAEERVTLRHRSTGQWAKNLAVRAKYDKDARIALAEQLSKSRELTVKLGKSQESDSDKEEEGDEEENQSRPEEDPDNPWVVKRSKEMEDFVSGYRKYWESQGKEREKLYKQDTSVKVNSNQEETGKLINNDLDKENTNPKEENKNCNETNDNGDSTTNEELDEKQSSPEMFNKTNENVNNINTELEEKKKTQKKMNQTNDRGNNAEFEEKQQRPKPLNASLTNNSFTVYEVTRNSTPGQDRIKNKFLSNFNIESVPNKKENTTEIDCSNKKEPSNCSSSNSKMNCSVGSWTISRKKDKTLRKVSSLKKQNICRFSNSFEITESKTTPNKVDIYSNTQAISIGENIDERLLNRKIKTVDELFEEVEDRLQDRIRDKIENIKEKINRKRRIESQSDNDSEQEGMPSLELKKKITPADIDKELIQERGDKSEERIESDLSKTLKTAGGEVKQAENIDPNKFLKVTQRHLLSHIPEIMTEGDDALDDEEKVAEDRHLTISEAFAEDDVVDQFQKEKEEEIKKSRVGNVDLALPGWGSWAGHNMRPVSRRKRKKFVIKFPKAIPRKDSNRGNVIINEDADKPIKEHQVSEVPFPFTSVEEYEASIRAPLGTTWMPQTAHAKLTMPPVVTKMGAVIAPMDETQLVSKNESLSSNGLKKNKVKTTKRKSKS